MRDPGVRIEVTRPARAHVRAVVRRESFDGSTFTDDRWHAMAAGPGRPGLLEPMGVHRDHRGHAGFRRLPEVRDLYREA